MINQHYIILTIRGVKIKVSNKVSNLSITLLELMLRLSTFTYCSQYDKDYVTDSVRNATARLREQTEN